MKFSQRIVATFLSALLAFQGFGFALPAYAASDDAVAAAVAEQEATSESNDASSEIATEDDAAAAGATEKSGTVDVIAESLAADASNKETETSANVDGEDVAVLADATATTSTTISTLSDLSTALGSSGSVKSQNGDAATLIEFSSDEALKIISNAPANLYQNATIKRTNMTGDTTTNLCGESSDGYSFQGFGSSTYPFAGKIVDSNGDALELTADRTVYNALQLTSDNSTISIVWKGSTSYSEPMVAESVVGASGSDASVTLKATVKIADPATKSDSETISDSSAALTAPLLGSAAGDLTVTADYSFAGTRKALNVSATGNIGLLANTITSGTFTIGNVTGLDDANDNGTIKTDSGNAGLFVGEVDAGAAVAFSPDSDFKLSNSITVESTSGCAGGLVGLAGQTTTGTSTATGSTVTLTKALNLSKLTVKGTTASGGLIGKAVNLTLEQESGANFTCPENVGSTDSVASGGFIGWANFSSDITFNANNEISTGTNGVTLAQKGDDTIDAGAGTVFGHLRLVGGDVSFVGNGAFTSKLTNGSNAQYGGIAGSVRSTFAGDGGTSARSLTVKSDTSGSPSIAITTDASPRFAGGIVGWLGKSDYAATVIVDGVNITCNSPKATEGFGGIVGALDQKSVLDAGSFAVSSTGDALSSKGAGVVGASWNSALYLHGTSDLSGFSIGSSSSVGQIAVFNTSSPSLAFASGSGSDTGWTYKRCPEVEADDIAGFGEVVRLSSALGSASGLSSGLITLDSISHQPVFNLGTSGSQLVAASSGYTISNANEFACYAITIQTKGVFSGVSGIGTSNWSDLLRATITLGGDIDLSGTGITGFTQDSDAGSASAGYFTGTLNGGEHTITLAIGEPYGTRNESALDPNDGSEGNGKIYYHNRLGLLSNDGGSTVNNLTLAGSIRAKNNDAMAIGSYAAEKCSAGTSTLSRLTVKTSLSLNQSNNKKMLAGNVYGTIEGTGSVTFGSSCAVTSSLNSNRKPNGNTRIGGVIGSVDGDSSTSIIVSDLTVSGSMTVAGGEIDNLGAGGFIAGIEKGDATKTVKISKLSLSSLALDFSDAKKTVGGFLGYSWANTNVTFKGDATAKTYALTTSGSKLSVSETGSNAFSLGGLVYRASGVWEVGDYAISYSGAKLSGSNIRENSRLGLLVCVGGDDGNLNGSLYLKNTADWSSAYNVSGLTFDGMDNFSNVDEWVYSTCASNKSVADCGSNGVISLHTDGEALDMSGTSTSRNSYANRTTLGTAHPTNGNSRYYYNLDRAVTAASATNNYIDTPSELLLWSVYRYAASNIKSNFHVGDAGSSNVIGGSSDTSTITLDMTGYSYYPVDVTGENVTVQNATITFCNSNIEAEENGNKLTSEQTQHMNMHAGLLRNFSCGDSATQSTTYTYKVNNVTLAGSVGMNVEDADAKKAGALLSGTMTGSSTGPAIAKLDITGLALNGIVVVGVNNSTSLAPLVACNLGTYTSLDVAGISASNYETVTAATSLFGNLGGEEADQVTASFTNVAVPSLSSGDAKNAIFTHASFLESYSYKQGGSSSAVYTFTQADRGNSKVTFGKEIDSAGEYSGKQLWYYDELLNGTDAGLVEDLQSPSITASATNHNFSVYLPYVTKGRSDSTYHEIKVNQRIPNLVTGCGTYGDPYVITSANQLTAIANFINAGTVLDGWTITIASAQETLCTRRSGKATSNETTYQYRASDSTWRKATYDSNTQTWSTDSTSDALADGLMRRYIQSCYLSIEPTSSDSDSTSNTLTVDTSSFSGLGNHNYPFRGVIVGNLASNMDAYATLVINNNDSKSFQGLIPYSYGSVVRNLNIQYVGNANSVSYTEKNSDDGVPTAFFGGVIGCIMGGDNIIDGVTVSKSGDFAAGASGDKSHLVAIGGYVGTIAGGGVIFRNMTGSSWHTGDKSLYDNPYVGRVIDGFAFSEDCTVDNGDANYKVNQLTDAGAACVTTSNIEGKYRTEANSAATVTVNNAQGLLVLSAIINSGAAAGAAHSSYTGDGTGIFAGSRAYQGWNQNNAYWSGYSFGNDAYGKVRNATYESVGRLASSSEGDDFSVSKNDDTTAPGTQEWGGALDAGYISVKEVNSPYLVANYANKETGYVCASKLTGISLQFAEYSTYDMADYGTGFLGLSGRYYSNACYSGQKTTDRERIVPRIACINGNGATISVTNNAQEYSDDDYCVAGVGGLFSTIGFVASNDVKDSISNNGDANVKDLNFANCNVSLSFVNSAGNTVSPKDNSSNSSGKVHVGVGCLAGATANYGQANDITYGVFQNVSIANSTITGGANAGGLIGSAGYENSTNSSDISLMVSYGWEYKSPIKLTDCSYSGITVSAYGNAGGFVGKIGVSNDGWESGVWVTSDKDVASNSTITGLDGVSGNESNTVGGVFGLTGCPVKVNTETTNGVATMKNVCVVSDRTTRGAGSLIGRTESTVTANKLTVQKTADSTNANAYIGSLSYDGTSYGNALSNVGGLVGYLYKDASFSDCTISGIQIAARENGGGIVGVADGNVTISANSVDVDNVTYDGSHSGGLIGKVSNSSSTLTALNVAIRNSAFSKESTMSTDHGDATGNYSGGIVGDMSGYVKLSNVLFDSNPFSNAPCQGFIVGDAVQSKLQGVYAAGIDIKLAADVSSTDTSKTPAVLNCYSETDRANINKKSYIAFADYTDADDGTSDLYDATGVSPYVTTSPKSKVAVKESNSTDAGYLFGDGAAITTAASSDTSANTILSQKGSDVAGRYTYTNIGGISDGGVYQNENSFSATSSVSTFNENNKTSQAATNFPVLLLSGNDTQTVTNYLDLVTNGGFSDAVRLNGDTNSHVTASVQTVKLSNGSFSVDGSATPTVAVVNNGGSSMSFRATSQWDNEKGQFSLLTVTFSEADQEYKVQVPIIVKRMLEIDFTATYAYGTNFKASDYGSLGTNAHVLASFNEPMTGYLTWTYNQAKGTATEYGWDTHLASGGSMGALGKSIVFSGNGTDGTLPAGTQLTLVDTAHNDKAYHYTVVTGGAASVKLIDFVDSNDDKYVEQWLSELMGVTAKEDSSGAWVECDSDNEADIAKAGAKVTSNGVSYYRPYNADTDSTNTRYTLTASKKDGKEVSPSENFYLVVNVPSSDGATASAVNGYTTTSFADSAINKNLNCTLRTDKGKSTDGHKNSASTYSIYSSYGQTLTDNNSSEVNQIKGAADTGYSLSMNVTDAITFDPSQKYTTSDKLYYQFSASLVNYSKNGDTATSSGATGFPTGTSGTLKFYVVVGDKYYTPSISDSDGSTTWTEATAGTPAATKSWTANGNDLSVVLSDGNSNAFDLSGLRNIAKNSGNAFSIIVESSDLKMTEEACKQAIAASQNGESYTKIGYHSSLSTSASTLSTSNLVANVDGNPGYYRKDSGNSTIELTASVQSQLGINVSDLALADGTIAAVGTYSFLKLANGSSKIDQASQVVYTLSLQQRTGTDGTYTDAAIGDYLSVAQSTLGTDDLSGDKATIAFTDTKSGGTFTTRDGNTDCFKFPFQVKVNTNIESAKHIYANYRIVLTASLLDAKGNVIDTPVNAIGASGYDNSDYLTYSLTKINVEGIPHSQTSTS